jgi:hypothetical protein
MKSPGAGDENGGLVALIESTGLEAATMLAFVWATRLIFKPE